MSEQVKHTPGPWHIEQASALGCYVQDESGWTIVRVGHTQADVDAGLTDKASSNARLIAAAPELLKALKACHAQLEAFEDAYEDAGVGDLWADAINAARAAITKATEIEL